MADTELVIKIDEEQYEFIKQSMTMDKVKDYHALLYNICERIKNGTPLPKGHGRLIDADRLKTHFVGTEQGTDLEVYLETTIIDAPTIIEADKEE